jgi:hypothetical protein
VVAWSPFCLGANFPLSIPKLRYSILAISPGYLEQRENDEPHSAMLKPTYIVSYNN